jgi:hypothetical protein
LPEFARAQEHVRRETHRHAPDWQSIVTLDGAQKRTKSFLVSNYQQKLTAKDFREDATKSNNPKHRSDEFESRSFLIR